MSVHQLKDGRWICKYADPATGKPRRDYFGRGKDAEDAAHQRNVSLGFGGHKAPSGVTLRAILAQYLAARQPSISKKTFSNLRYKIGSVILPTLGRVEAMGVNHDVLDSYVRARTPRVTNSTIHAELSTIKAALRWAVKRRLLTHNPMEGYPMPTKDDAVIQPPTAAEFAAIYNAAAPHIKRALLIGFYTGARFGRSELLAIRWEHVDMDNSMIFMVSAKKGGMKSRSIPLAEPLKQAMLKWMDEDRQRGPLGWVIHYGGKPVGHIYYGWRTAVRKAGILRRLNPYSIRHLAATSMLERGADLKAVSEILGHSSPATTMQKYQHVSTSLRVDAISRLGNQLPDGLK